jgi:hypothetical protein
MAARYLLCPGAVRSRTDGQLHDVGASQLAMLYGARMAECVVLPDLDSCDSVIRRIQLKGRVWSGELIALHPRYDGRYKLPEAKP